VFGADLHKKWFQCISGTNVPQHEITTHSTPSRGNPGSAKVAAQTRRVFPIVECVAKDHAQALIRQRGPFVKLATVSSPTTYPQVEEAPCFVRYPPAVRQRVAFSCSLATFRRINVFLITVHTTVSNDVAQNLSGTNLPSRPFLSVIDCRR